MTDVFSSDKRSEIMASIRSKNSKAELMVFKHLRKQGIYFQKHYSRVAGKPDVALPRKKRACFIDGDFWHGRTLESVRARRGNDDYWTVKIQRNIARDIEQRNMLHEKGWRILSVWESDIIRKRTRDDTLNIISNFLTEP